VDGLHLEELEESFGAALAAQPGLLEAAERHRRVEQICSLIRVVRAAIADARLSG